MRLNLCISDSALSWWGGTSYRRAVHWAWLWCHTTLPTGVIHCTSADLFLSYPSESDSRISDSTVNLDSLGLILHCLAPSLSSLFLCTVDVKCYHWCTWVENSDLADSLCNHFAQMFKQWQSEPRSFWSIMWSGRQSLMLEMSLGTSSEFLQTNSHLHGSSANPFYSTSVVSSPSVAIAVPFLPIYAYAGQSCKCWACFQGIISFSGKFFRDFHMFAGWVYMGLWMMQS